MAGRFGPAIGQPLGFQWAPTWLAGLPFAAGGRLPFGPRIGLTTWIRVGNHCSGGWESGERATTAGGPGERGAPQHRSPLQLNWAPNNPQLRILCVPGSLNPAMFTVQLLHSSHGQSCNFCGICSGAQDGLRTAQDVFCYSPILSPLGDSLTPSGPRLAPLVRL